MSALRLAVLTCLCAAFLAVGSAAAQPPKKKSAEPAAGQKTIGLMSLVGDVLIVKTVGVTVFENEEHKVPIPGWKINDRIAAVAARQLKKAFRIKSIAVPAAAFEKFNQGDFIFKSYDEELAKFLSGFAGAQRCDYYLVVAPGFDRVSSTNQQISGLGVLRMSSIFASSEFVHAYTRLLVFDAKFAPVRGEADFDHELRLLPLFLRGPSREMKEGERLPPDPQAIAADPRAQKITTELLEASIAKTLPKLFATN